MQTLDDAAFRQRLRAIPISVSVALDCCVVLFLLVAARFGAKVFSVMPTRLFGLLLVFDVMSQLALVWISYSDDETTCNINSLFLLGGYTAEFASSFSIAYILVRIVGFPERPPSRTEEVVAQVFPLVRILEDGGQEWEGGRMKPPRFVIRRVKLQAHEKILIRSMTFDPVTGDCWFADRKGLAAIAVISMLFGVVAGNVIVVLAFIVRLAILQENFRSSLEASKSAAAGTRPQKIMTKISRRMLIYPVVTLICGAGSFALKLVLGTSGIARLASGFLAALLGIINAISFFFIDPAAGIMARQALEGMGEKGSLLTRLARRVVELVHIVNWGSRSSGGR
ncbi:hypothetical protein M427DRAFT_45615 [Gonapodya prolifera JEL478]|uniref:G-protein coupled receptors family 1 profile domain-containing protein n=1 Tax=Gonapodya prolifera (strain JEL478) TaxID=1344416 RepID=A0A139A9E8_GONPJ|nr:hypothetical protein M427DRAFT_45615 [Gonapodya prolifera JEL478]|eukprot:KXS13451.1 hypothetical protein M427DRAFT_45615 [Gonapodya prolifera JEL478]